MGGESVPGMAGAKMSCLGDPQGRWWGWQRQGGWGSWGDWEGLEF